MRVSVKNYLELISNHLGSLLLYSRKLLRAALKAVQPGSIHDVDAQVWGSTHLTTTYMHETRLLRLLVSKHSHLRSTIPETLLLQQRGYFLC